MQIPIQTIFLFPALDRKLISLLQALPPEDWHKPTRARLWNVKDIVAHLLDGNFRTLSMIRDGYFGEKAEGINSYQELVDYLNRLNADWVKSSKRLSPQVLISLLEISGQQCYEHLKRLDPFAKAIFAVAWAGEETSLNWFHIAREYSEKWHHQQQIREAVGQPGIMSRELYHPVLETFVRAMPHTYRNIEAEPETSVKVIIKGEAGGEWGLRRSKAGWEMIESQKIANQTEITMDQDTAWKLFTKGLTREEVEQNVMIEGERVFGEPMLSIKAIMA